MNEEVQRIYELAERWSADDLLRWASTAFGGTVEIASAFGAEGVVLIDIASRIQSPLRVFTLDTDFLFPETYELMRRLERKYEFTIERMHTALTPQMQEGFYGPALWSRDPDTCCNLRKIEPLREKLSTLQAWITSIRRDQTTARANAKKVEWDEQFHLVKINPLADWTSAQVWQYIHEHEVPYNPLHNQGYPSIGCTHCTRAVLPGENSRAGRWAGFAKTECGLHQKPAGGDIVRIASVQEPR